jgi:DNA-binding transcriptional MerR regulator
MVMPLSRSRDYLSIGEVLDAVRPEFPDVSISKIRFLESEGLLEPERTSSGYRKFYDRDVERLRYILTLQRDHFMPLKVIKDRIHVGAPAPQTNGGAPITAPPAPAAPAAPAGSAAEVMTGVQMDRPEFLRATGLSEQDLAGLEDFGIVVPRDGSYDENDLLVGKSAKGFLNMGVEPRHLRMYRQFTERESGFFEQLVGPAAMRKDADAGRQTGETLNALAALSRTMREGLARATLRDML